MSWIELHGQLFFHPKTVIAANELTRGDAEKMVGHLSRLWTWAIDHVEDGNLAHLNDRAIAEAAGWRRAPKRFVEALTTAGFLDADRSIHDWDDYAGKLLDRRKADRERKRRDYATKRRAISPMDSPQESPPDIRTHRTRPDRTVPNHVGTDTDGSGQVSTASSPSGNREVSEKNLRAITEDLLGVEDWPLERNITRGVALKLLAAFRHVPIEDFGFAVGSYRLMHPIKARTEPAVFKAVSSWLSSYFRREHLKSLVGQLCDGRTEAMDEDVEQLLEDAVGTSIFGEMNATDVETAIAALERFDRAVEAG